MDIRVHDIDAELILIRRIAALPGRDATATGPQHDGAVGHPGGAEAVEEIRLAGDLGRGEVGVAQLANVDGVLVGVEAGVVEAAVGVGDAEGEGGVVGVGREVVDEVEVVGAEVAAAEGRVGRYGVARGSGAREGGVEGWGDGEGRGVGVVEAGDGDGGPGYGDEVGGLREGEGGLAEEVGWARARNVNLFGVGAGGDEDCEGVFDIN